jgi:FkbM family methyltransferase
MAKKYNAYTEYTRRVKETLTSALMSLVKNRIYTSRSGLTKGLKLKGGLGFIPRQLSSEEKFLLGLDINGQTIYDIGGAAGIFTIFFARSVGKNGKVITFEPNPWNCNMIFEHLKLNNLDNVEVQQIALGKKREKGTLAVRQSETGTGSLQEDIKASILQEKGAETIQVEIDTLDNQIATNNLPKPDFVKIDVEGLEMDVLDGMREIIKNYKPKLFIEIHGVDVQRKIENVQRVVDFLIAREYSIYHIESGDLITSSNTQIAKAGHLYAY